MNTAAKKLVLSFGCFQTFALLSHLVTMKRNMLSNDILKAPGAELDLQKKC